MDALLLGLSSGASCLASCSPFLLPILAAGAGEGRARRAGLVVLFLAGRLIAYAAAGYLAGSAGALAAGYLAPGTDRLLLRAGWALGGAVLLAGGLAGVRGPRVCAFLGTWENRPLSALLLGLAAGLNLCPPFIAAAGRAAGLGAAGGMVYFLLFFLGTSVWTALFALAPSFKKHAQELRAVARITMILLGVYFLVILGVFGWN
jgi:hypothetical protein